MRIYINNFQRYYYGLTKDEAIKLRSEIINQCGISPYSFYPCLMGQRNWSRRNQEIISKLINISIENLF